MPSGTLGVIDVGSPNVTFQQFELIDGTTSATGRVNVSGALDWAAVAPSVEVAVGSGGRLSLVGRAQSLSVADGGIASIGGGTFTANQVTVGAGGTLGGSGQIQGNVAFGPESTLAVNVAAADAGPVLTVSGQAALAGSVEVTAIDPEESYVNGQTTTILQADGGVTGQFSDVSMASGSAFMTPTLAYTPDGVQLSLFISSDFTTVASSPNQQQVAKAFNGFTQSGDALLVYNELAQLDASSARKALELASGEVHASGQQLIDQTFAMFSGSLGHHGDQGGPGESSQAPMGYFARPAAARADLPDLINLGTDQASEPRRGTAWLTPFGGRGVVNASVGAAAQQWSAAGLAGGYESALATASGYMWAGVALGYGQAATTVDARLSQMDNSVYQAAIYGGWTDKAWTLSGSAGVGLSSVNTRRTIAFGGINRVAEAQYIAGISQVTLQTEYAFELTDDLRISPFAGLAARWSGHGGFTETGAGALNLTGAPESGFEADLSLGIALSHDVHVGDATVTLEAQVAWEHALAGGSASQGMTFQGGPVPFNVQGTDDAADRIQLGAAASMKMTDALSIGASYSTVFSGTQHNHAASLTAKASF